MRKHELNKRLYDALKEVLKSDYISSKIILYMKYEAEEIDLEEIVAYYENFVETF